MNRSIDLPLSFEHIRSLFATPLRYTIQEVSSRTIHPSPLFVPEESPTPLPVLFQNQAGELEWLTGECHAPKEAAVVTPSLPDDYARLWRLYFSRKRVPLSPRSLDDAVTFLAPHIEPEEQEQVFSFFSLPVTAARAILLLNEHKDNATKQAFRDGVLHINAVETMLRHELRICKTLVAYLYRLDFSAQQQKNFIEWSAHCAYQKGVSVDTLLDSAEFNALWESERHTSAQKRERLLALLSAMKHPHLSGVRTAWEKLVARITRHARTVRFTPSEAFEKARCTVTLECTTPQQARAAVESLATITPEEWAFLILPGPDKVAESDSRVE